MSRTLRTVVVTVMLTLTLEALICFWIYYSPYYVEQRRIDAELAEAKHRAELTCQEMRWCLLDTKYGLICFKPRTAEWIDD